jgi:predicted Rdx family selenoprotein
MYQLTFQSNAGAVCLVPTTGSIFNRMCGNNLGMLEGPLSVKVSVN